MTVSELITQLEQCDPADEVKFLSHYAGCAVEITGMSYDIGIVYLENIGWTI